MWLPVDMRTSTEDNTANDGAALDCFSIRSVFPFPILSEQQHIWAGEDPICVYFFGATQ